MRNQKIQVGQLETAQIQGGVVFPEVLHFLVYFIIGQLRLIRCYFYFERHIIVVFFAFVVFRWSGRNGRNEACLWRGVALQFGQQLIQCCFRIVIFFEKNRFLRYGA